MDACTVSGVHLRSLFEVCKEFVEEVGIRFSKRGITMTSLDVNKVVLVNFKLRTSMFERYKCNGEILACVNMLMLHNAFRCVQPQDCMVRMRISERNLKKLEVIIMNKKSKTLFKHELKLWGHSKEQITMDNSQFSHWAEMPSAEFQRHVTNISSMMNNDNANSSVTCDITMKGSHMTLAVESDWCVSTLDIGATTAGYEVHDDAIDPLNDTPVEMAAAESGAGGGGADAASSTFLSTGTVTGESASETATAMAQRGEPVAAGPPDKITGTYLVRYLKCIAKAKDLSPKVEIFQKVDYPIVFRFRVSTFGTLCFCLCPYDPEGDAHGHEDMAVGDELEQELLQSATSSSATVDPELASEPQEQDDAPLRKRGRADDDDDDDDDDDSGSHMKRMAQ